MESARSWGLNRAIFIAAAKRGFKGGAGKGEAGVRKTSKRSGVYYLGDDMAYKVEREGKTLFTIGGEVQTEGAFDRQVKARFGRHYPAAWREAVAYVKTFDKETLLSGEGFYREVYKPRRDELAEEWSEASATPAPRK